MGSHDIDFVNGQGKTMRRIRLTEEVILEYLWESGSYWLWLRVKVASWLRSLRRSI